MKMMKQVFVLDENIFIQSHTCRNISDSDDDFNSLNLIINILDRCHRIGLSSELIGKYYEKSKILEKSGKIANAIRIWKHLLNRSDKHSMCDSHLTNLPSNIKHDSHVIDPTVFLPGILVTTDEKLKEKFLQWAEKQQHTISVKSPWEAIEYISEIEGSNR